MQDSAQMEESGTLNSLYLVGYCYILHILKLFCPCMWYWHPILSEHSYAFRMGTTVFLCAWLVIGDFKSNFLVISECYYTQMTHQ